MDSINPNENRSLRCSFKTFGTSIFLVQGIVLAAVGIVGVFTYTNSDVECVRLRNINVLLLVLACFHLVSSVICCIHCKNYNTNHRVFIANVLWSCVICCLVTFHTLQVYKYKQTMTPHVLYTIIMTGVLGILVLIVWCLHVTELCKRKEKSDMLLLV